MRRMFSDTNERSACQLTIFVALFLCVGLAGCDNSCIAFYSNPSHGSVAIIASPCAFGQANGRVQLQLISSPLPSSASSLSVQHIFVSLRAIQARTKESPGADSSGWQDLAPNLTKSPAQVDLLRVTPGSPASTSFGETIVRASTYSEIRILLVSAHLAEGETAPAGNACGNQVYNCIVTADGESRSLLFDGASTQHLISSESITGGFLTILPDATTNLVLEFNPYRSMVSSTPGSVWLHPVFAAHAERLPVPAEESGLR
jgi:hypothetical protein